jgi:exonuclease III
MADMRALQARLVRSQGLAPRLARIRESHNMKVVTYNFCKGGPNYDALHGVLTTLQPGILFAQELRNPQDYVNKKHTVDWRTLGYQDHIWCPVPGNYEGWGSAIFMKRGAISRRIDIPKELRGWVIGGECDLSVLLDQQPGPTLKLFSVHTPTRHPINCYPVQAQGVLEFLKEEQKLDASILVAGDFNVTIGVRGQNEEPRMTPMEHSFITYFRRSLGLINCWQAIHPNTPLPRTFRRESSTARVPHIDGIFISAPLDRYLHTCRVEDVVPDWPTRDHNPVVAEFDTEMPVFEKIAKRSSFACATADTTGT